MATKLFVGGLSWGTVDTVLREAFERFGAVSDAKVVMDRVTGRSRGFGFVTMEDPAAAHKAIEALDGQPLDGRPVKVSQAHDRGPRRAPSIDRGEVTWRGTGVAGRSYRPSWAPEAPPAPGWSHGRSDR